MTGSNARALLTFHHILSSRKKTIIQKSAKELGLVGICKVGYPGVLAVEGGEQPVRQYVREIKVYIYLPRESLKSGGAAHITDHRRFDGRSAL